ncbi:MAG: hypothetical protein R3A79_20960 [Nannocystaceae bacterium]
MRNWRPIVLFACAAQLAACRASGRDGPGEPVDAAAKEGAPTEPDASASGAAKGDDAATPPEVPGPPASGVDELPALHGETEAELLARFGAPTSRRTFTMAECCTEFEIELYNTYRPNEGHDAVEIHEWTWAYTGYALTVWFHRQGDAWLALDTSIYDDGVEF